MLTVQLCFLNGDQRNKYNAESKRFSLELLLTVSFDVLFVSHEEVTHFWGGDMFAPHLTVMHNSTMYDNSACP